MNSKERVLTALNHREPDRVPINFVGANADIDRRLKAHFGLGKNDHEGLLEALNVDFRVLDLPCTGPRLHAEIEGLGVDPQWGIRTRWEENESGGYSMAPTHMAQDNSSTENVLAACQAALDFGRY